MIFGINSLNTRAPWLAPNTSSFFLPSSGLLPIAKNSARTGVPVTFAP